MIYRPLEATRRKTDLAADDDGGREANVPRSLIFRKIVEDKRRRRTTSTGSMDGAVITRDNCVMVEVQVADSVADSLHVIREQFVEEDAATTPRLNEVGIAFSPARAVLLIPTASVVQVDQSVQCVCMCVCVCVCVCVSGQ